MSIYSASSRSELMKRILLHSVGSLNPDFVVNTNPSHMTVTGPNDNKLNKDWPYGILPKLMAANIPELDNIIEYLQVMKMLAAEQGQYYEMWRYAGRQSIAQNIKATRLKEGLN